MIFNLHPPNDATPHTFDEEPKSVFVAVRRRAPDAGTIPEVDISVRHLVNIDALPFDLRRVVLAVLGIGEAPDGDQVPGLVGSALDPGLRLARVEPKTVLHDHLDSFVNALADCRAGDGTLLTCDDPRSRRIGFVHHPDEGDSVVHEIGLQAIKATTVSEEIAARIGLAPDDVRTRLVTYEGRHTLVTGTSPEPDTTPEQDDLLQAVMMADPVRVDVQSDGGQVNVVDFPDVELFQIEDTVGSVPDLKFYPIRPRPAWMPDGWATLDLAKDWYRVGVLDDTSPVGATGAFARRGDHLFRAFDDGRWDESTWHPPADADGGRYIPGGYRVHHSGHVGKADIEAALAAVLPSYHAAAPAVVRGGAP